MTVDGYLANLPEDKRVALQRLRTLVRELVPKSDEQISYGIPAFKYKGKPLLYYAAFKDHLSLFPTSEPAEHFKDKLTGYKVSKGTIRYTLANPLPESLVKELILYRKSIIDRE
jgi:uncharacterized protein YdhG (YjbR/CyaY superfamily)